MTPPTSEWFEINKENASKILQSDAFKNLTGKELGILFKEKTEEIWKTDKKESKETATKSLEFEKNTFKIDSKGWKEVTNKDKDDPILGKFVWKKPKVKVNATWDVVEYLEWPAKWEQIFITYDAFIREVMKTKNCSQKEVEEKYMLTIDELKEKMKDKPTDSKNYKKFFNEECNGHLAGYRHPDTKLFYAVGEQSSIWLVGRLYADFIQNNRWYSGYNHGGYGFSGRLLKN